MAAGREGAIVYKFTVCTNDKRSIYIWGFCLNCMLLSLVLVIFAVSFGNA